MTDQTPATASWSVGFPPFSPAHHREIMAAFQRAFVESPPPGLRPTGRRNAASLTEPITVAVATLRGPGSLASLESPVHVALAALAARAAALGQITCVAATGLTSLAFVVMAEWTDREARLMHQVLTRPIDVGGAAVWPEVSIGVAVASAVDRCNAADLLARASLAVPPRGGSRLVHLEPPDTTREQGLEADVAPGLRRGEFVAYYQPQFDLVTGEAVGSEALARWKHPHRGVLTPAVFLPLIDCTGASTELASSMVRCVSADRLHRAEAGLPGKVAVNVTADDLLDETFVQVLGDAGNQLWRQISLEVTEAHVVRSEAVATLEELAALGYAIALDDFGTGYSTLSAIHTLPVSAVKIDRSFVARLPDDPSAEALIAAMSALCDQLGLTVIAEGIETHAQARVVRDLGCRVGQGYLLSRPQPLHAFTPDKLNRSDIAAVTSRAGARRPAPSRPS